MTLNTQAFKAEAAYSAAMDKDATPAETAAVQSLFDEIDLPLEVTATYTGKMFGEALTVAVLWLTGRGVAKAYFAAAEEFGKAVGSKVGEYAGDGVVEWLRSLRQVRPTADELPVIIHDPELGIEIRLTGNETPEAIARLVDRIEGKKLHELPGVINEVRYDPDSDGWVRPM